MKNLHWSLQALLFFVVIVSAYYVGDVLLEKRASKGDENG